MSLSDGETSPSNQQKEIKMRYFITESGKPTNLVFVMLVAATVFVAFFGL